MADPEMSPPGTVQATTAPAGQMAEADERQYALFLHLSALIGIIGIPPVIGPLVMWLIKKDESGFVDAHGKAALNFHLSMLIYAVGLVIIGIVLLIILVGFLFFVLAALLGLFSMIMAVIAGIKANNGESFQYPLAIPLLK